MEIIKIDPDQIVSMNDYPPLHSPDALKKYYDMFRNNRSDKVTPIPIIPVSVVVPYMQNQHERFAPYNQQLYSFLKTHPNATYFMLDGTHRAAGAMLANAKIPAYLIKDDEDVNALFSLRSSGRISISGILKTLPETIGILEEHYQKTKKFWTLEEKVIRMISNGDIRQDMLLEYNKK